MMWWCTKSDKYEGCSQCYGQWPFKSGWFIACIAFETFSAFESEHHLQFIQNYKARLDILLETVTLFTIGLKLLH